MHATTLGGGSDTADLLPAASASRHHRAPRVTSRWVVELFGTVWVRAKSLPGSHIAPSAHRH